LFAKSDEVSSSGRTMRILLASASERRGAILREHFRNVEQAALQGVDETVDRLPISEQVKEVASRKAAAVALDARHDVFVVSDTLVEDPDDEQEALGKPGSKEQALSMLLRLRGRRHRVWSATMVYVLEKWQSSVECAIVEIEDFSDDVLVELIESESWVGKAGGYDLAGMMGTYATLIEGAESTVLGFTQSSIEFLTDLQSLFSMRRS
jgi:septum formation protein